jgi:dolichyl-phosphate-mannose-protein mannosyltransferase
MQYAQYAGIVPPTPQRSEPPVATVGGEPGGRPPVLVNDQIPKIPVEKEQTTVAFGKAEPGVDIFAGDAVKDIKSEHAAPSPPAEEKEISSVFSKPSSTETSSVDTEKKKGEEPANAASSSTSEHIAAAGKEADFSIQTHPATEAKDEEGHAHKNPQGPLDEPAAEANRAAKELYPEAQHKV